MNEIFTNRIKRTGLSLYQISAESGIPYTTINQLCRGQRDINKVSAETVMRLANYLDVEPEKILNPIYYLKNVKSTVYEKKFQWVKKDGRMYVRLLETDEMLPAADNCFGRDSFKYVNILAEFAYDDYVKEKEFDEIVDKVKKRLKKEGGIYEGL